MLCFSGWEVLRCERLPTMHENFPFPFRALLSSSLPCRVEFSSSQQLYAHFSHLPSSLERIRAMIDMLGIRIAVREACYERKTKFVSLSWRCSRTFQFFFLLLNPHLCRFWKIFTAFFIFGSFKLSSTTLLVIIRFTRRNNCESLTENV